MKWIFVFLALVCTPSLGCQPVIRMYETLEDGEVAVERTFVTDLPDLRERNITNQRQLHTCPEGVWMAYRNENFTGALGERYVLSGAQDGVFNCNPDSRIIRSLKVVGSPEDYSQSAVVTYLGSNNYGKDTTYLNDTGRTNATFQSLILVGQEPIQIFTEEDFLGDSFCVQSNNGDISGKVEFHLKNQSQDGDALYTNLQDLQSIFGTADFKSFKFGCDNVKEVKMQRGKLC